MTKMERVWKVMGKIDVVANAIGWIWLVIAVLILLFGGGVTIEIKFIETLKALIERF